MSSDKQVAVLWKFLYAILFVLLLPALLVEWAQLTDEYVHLPALNAFFPGFVIALIGAIISFLGIVAIMLYGNGLPMNAFPPQKYVSEGIYKLLPHPIYVGFSIFCVGCSIMLGSAAGLWLVSPVVILSCTALVQGFEKHDLHQRFGNFLTKPILDLPRNEDRAPLRREIVSVYLLVLLPWLILYECVSMIGAPPDAFSGYFAFEKNLSVVEWTEIIYVCTYIYVMLAPVMAKSARTLREFAITGLTATFLGILLFAVIPLIASPREYVPKGFFGTLLLWERAYDTPAAAFPSFHVIWAFLAARAFGQSYPRMKYLWWFIAIIISVSCITTGMHAVVDIIGALLVLLVVWNISGIWSWIQRHAERIANSWKEWHFGPVRVINHGMYTGIGSFFGLLIVGTILGPDHVGYALIVSAASLIAAGLWAQFIEGSPRLLRPYGYYGGVLGVILGAALGDLLGGDFWLLLGAFSVAGPWIQAAGRLRCLVQGCCHGREASPKLGIRYNHPMSRVNKIAGLKGVPLHPTQVYSILWNVACGIILGRIWSVHASLPLLSGIYLILNGLGRFVEESYRGEPQTPIFGKMRLYQWMSGFSVVSGAVLTTISADASIPNPQLNWSTIFAGIVFGMIIWFAQGVDFPKSNKRFARLA
jgi:protein-S-isoprenylcysteine O-methyltransferase Ste14